MSEVFYIVKIKPPCLLWTVEGQDSVDPSYFYCPDKGRRVVRTGKVLQSIPKLHVVYILLSFFFNPMLKPLVYTTLCTTPQDQHGHCNPKPVFVLKIKVLKTN